MNDGFFLTLAPYRPSQRAIDIVSAVVPAHLRPRMPPLGAELEFPAFTHWSGCHGLARMSPVQLEVLSVHATKPRTGQLRVFVKSAQDRFNRVIFIQVQNQILAQALFRYGFRKGDGTDEVGADMQVMLWARNGRLD